MIESAILIQSCSLYDCEDFSHQSLSQDYYYHSDHQHQMSYHAAHEFWTQLFSNIEIRIMITTVYHSQFNNQSEYINQIVKIILQYALEEASNADFINFLSAFKQMFNNSINAFTEQTSNEIIYGFDLTDSFDMITDDDAKKFKAEHKIHQQETQDSIVWANLIMKNCYDKHHISLLLNPEDLIILKLHHEYCVFSIKNKKLFIQQVDCFSIK